MNNKQPILSKSEHKKNLKELRIKRLEQKMKNNMKKRKINKKSKING
tara:strand:+ start:298 stop:438 length:141 start_codon:yes stop_codon:yes gene_type:complete